LFPVAVLKLGRKTLEQKSSFAPLAEMAITGIKIGVPSMLVLTCFAFEFVAVDAP